MALYFYFNSTTGDLVYSDKATYSGSGYTSLGQQTDTDPDGLADWVFHSKRASIKTVTKDPNISGRINNLTSMVSMFTDCTALTSIDFSGFDTPNVTGMDAMFSGCTALTSLDLSGLDMSNVSTMQSTFYGCSSLVSLYLSGFNKSNLTSLYNTFEGCTALTSLDLSGFDTSNVTNMRYLFADCNALTSLDLSGFDTSSATKMDNIFLNCSALRIIDISQNMSNILSQLPAATYYDAVTRQSYAKASIPGGSTYVRDLADLDLIATMVQTRMGINMAKHLAHKALKKAKSTVVRMSNVDVVRTAAHRTDYDRDTLEVVTDSMDKVTAMYLINAR